MCQPGAEGQRRLPLRPIHPPNRDVAAPVDGPARENDLSPQRGRDQSPNQAPPRPPFRYEGWRSSGAAVDDPPRAASPEIRRPTDAPSSGQTKPPAIESARSTHRPMPAPRLDDHAITADAFFPRTHRRDGMVRNPPQGLRFFAQVNTERSSGTPPVARSPQATPRCQTQRARPVRPSWRRAISCGGISDEQVPPVPQQ